MNNLNVLKYSCRPRYYLTHPWAFFKETGQNLRAAWWRITRGYAPQDVWSWDAWFLEVTPPMFRHLAKYSCGYPGFEPFETPEKWQDWLNSVADVLESLQEENWESRNEFAEEFYQLSKWNRNLQKDENDFVHVTWSNEGNYDEIKELYFIRQQELNEEWQKLIEDTFKQLSINFAKIWD